MKIKIALKPSPDFMRCHQLEGYVTIGSILFESDQGEYQDSAALLQNKESGAYYKYNQGRSVVGLMNTAEITQILTDQGYIKTPYRPKEAQVYSKRMISGMVCLDDESREILRSYGEGNLSLGIRRAAELVKICVTNT